ncbi:hypothetical protein D041_4159A, partial [Vibrio parahaemolyticus EKP-008]
MINIANDLHVFKPLPHF